MVHLEQAAVSNSHADAAPPADAWPSGDERPRILLAVDAGDLARWLVAILEAAGYRATAIGRWQFLGAVRDAPPALVVADLDQHRDAWAALCRRLRAWPRTRRVPLLLASALGAGEVAAIAGDLAAWGYLAKPYSPGALLAAVRHFAPDAAITTRTQG